MFVHFPIALLFTSVPFNAARAWFRRENFRDGSLWLLLLSLLGGIATAIADNWTEEAAEKVGPAESMIEQHKTLAFVILETFGILHVCRLMLRN